ncbi:MAG: NADPH-dependent 7-cyano-7-deazaguanine reductase QueF [Spirochaetales bacterium]|nr:NADPH-dependent 7-cyano-7-deazaguanine reductase QueF [Spirochaetales bacterium]
MSKLKTFINKVKNKDYTIDITCAEFTSLCPKTGQPDFAVITISYVPDKLCVELKSFKLYMFSYRNIGEFHEHVTNKILDDFVKACKPKYASITGDFNIRGGIKTVVQAEYKKKIKRKKL